MRLSSPLVAPITPGMRRRLGLEPFAFSYRSGTASLFREPFAPTGFSLAGKRGTGFPVVAFIFTSIAPGEKKSKE
jgi:hypothetical protein